ncbi:MAG: methyl-accepting chemotaxis protein [Myxococcaceae bacterium]
MARPVNDHGLWLTAPTITGQLVATVLAAAYATLAMRFQPGLVVLLGGLGALAVALVAGYGAVSARLATRKVRRLAHLEATKAELTGAVQEVAAAADKMFWVGIQSWAVGSVGVGVALWALGDGVAWGLSLRVCGLGVLFGPLGSMLAYLLVTLRARNLIEELALCGLTPQEVIVALPPGRAQIRRRLVLFTAVLVIIPAILTADTSATLSQQAFERVISVPGPEQRSAAIEERREAIVIVGVLGGLVLSLAMVAAAIMGTALSRPMRRIALQATRIAEGDLGRVVLIPAEDEVWAVSAAFTTLQAHLTQVLSKLKGAGLRIGATTEQIVATSGRYEAGAAAQAGALNETSATTEELARSARQIADNGASVATIAQTTLAAAQAGQESAQAFAGSVDRICHDNQAISDAVAKLGKRVQQIGRIVEFINGVADRSDLLALSAELEGTKAGEVGRGFSLVAAEMRRLAENVLESTREIEELIEEIRDATSGAAAATDEGVKATFVGAGLATQVEEALRTIVELAGQTSDAVRAISLSTQQQQTGTDQLAEAMGDILKVTQQSLQTTKQVGVANAGLSTLAKELQGVVERFRIEG